MRARYERYYYLLPRNPFILTVGCRCKHLPAGLCSREEMFVWEGNQHCETRLLLVFWQGLENLIVWGNYSLVKQKQWGERKRNAKDDIYYDSSAGEFAILACHNLHLHLHFNCSLKTFALEQIQEKHTWNMHPHTDTGLGWLPNLLQWEELAVGGVSKMKLFLHSPQVSQEKPCGRNCRWAFICSGNQTTYIYQRYLKRDLGGLILVSTFKST